MQWFSLWMTTHWQFQDGWRTRWRVWCGIHIYGHCLHFSGVNSVVECGCQTRKLLNCVCSLLNRSRTKKNELRTKFMQHKWPQCLYRAACVCALWTNCHSVHEWWVFTVFLSTVYIFARDGWVTEWFITFFNKTDCFLMTVFMSEWLESYFNKLIQKTD